MKSRYKILVLVLIISLSINAVIIYTLDEKKILNNFDDRIFEDEENFQIVNIPDIYKKNSVFGCLLYTSPSPRDRG